MWAASLSGGQSWTNVLADVVAKTLERGGGAFLQSQLTPPRRKYDRRLVVALAKPGNSPYAALKDAGVLVEEKIEERAGDRTVTERRVSIVGELLSTAMEPVLWRKERRLAFLMEGQTVAGAAALVATAILLLAVHVRAVGGTSAAVAGVIHAARRATWVVAGGLIGILVVSLVFRQMGAALTRPRATERDVWKDALNRISNERFAAYAGRLVPGLLGAAVVWSALGLTYLARSGARCIPKRSRGSGLRHRRYLRRRCGTPDPVRRRAVLPRVDNRYSAQRPTPHMDEGNRGAADADGHEAPRDPDLARDDRCRRADRVVRRRGRCARRAALYRAWRDAARSCRFPLGARGLVEHPGGLTR